MSTGYRLRIVGAHVSDVHRTRNFAEELDVELRRHDIGSVSDPDGVVNEVVVVVRASRRLGDARTTVRRVAAKHAMENEIEFERFDAPSV